MIVIVLYIRGTYVIVLMYFFFRVKDLVNRENVKKALRHVYTKRKYYPRKVMKLMC